MNRKFMSISIAATIMAGAVTFSACKKDNKDDPAADGKKASQEECACFDLIKSYKDVESYDDLTSAQQTAFDAAEVKMKECFDAVRKKYKKYENDNNDSPFFKAWDAEDENCTAWSWTLMNWW